MPKKPSKYEDFFAKDARFGEWTIVNPNIRKGIKDHEVLCRCSCGFEGYISASNVARGKSTRCGECRRDASTKQTGSNNPFWKGVGEIPSGKFRRIRDQATREFLAKLWDDCDKHCALTGVPLTMGVDASPDRIDSSIGYVDGNVQWVHKDVNIMKNAFDIDYFIETCRKIAGKFPADKNKL